MSLPAERLALRPAADGSDAIVGGDRGAVAPLQPFAQAKGVRQPIRADVPAFQHLRLVVALAVDADQGVEHHVGEYPRRIDGGDDRVEDLQLGAERDTERAVLRLGRRAAA